MYEHEAHKTAKTKTVPVYKSDNLRGTPPSVYGLGGALTALVPPESPVKRIRKS